MSAVYLLSLGLMCFCTMAAATPEMLVGGVGSSRPADDNVRGIVSSLGEQIKTKALARLTESGANTDNNAFKSSPIEVLSYSTQVVAGTNYFVKVKIYNSVFHARIYKNLSGSLELSNLVLATESGPITYF